MLPPRPLSIGRCCGVPGTCLCPATVLGSTNLKNAVVGGRSHAGTAPAYAPRRMQATVAARGFIGRVVEGRFVIVDVLGEGAMSIVFRGFELRSLAEVAVKVLRAELAVDSRIVRQFHREASFVGRVGHDSVVRIRSNGADDGLHYIVMELCSGRSLADALSAETRLNQARAINLVVQLCGALAVAHANGVVHRDIKPENIMLIDGGARLGERVKLVDFGAATSCVDFVGAPFEGMTGYEQTALTSVGALIGTPHYMAPEQCAGTAAVDARADIYACGVVLFEMVTGQRPFDAGGHRGGLRGAHKGRYPERTWHRAVDRARTGRCHSKALAKAPSDRFQSAEELRLALVAVLDAILEAELEPTQPVQYDRASGSGGVSAVDPLGLFSVSAASEAPPVMLTPPRRATEPVHLRPHLRNLGMMLVAAMISVGTVALVSAYYHWRTVTGAYHGACGPVLSPPV